MSMTARWARRSLSARLAARIRVLSHVLLFLPLLLLAPATLAQPANLPANVRIVDLTVRDAGYHLHVAFGTDADGRALRLSVQQVPPDASLQLFAMTSRPDARPRPIPIRAEALVDAAGTYTLVAVEGFDPAAHRGQRFRVAFSEAARVALPSLPETLDFEIDENGKIPDASQKPVAAETPRENAPVFSQVLWLTEHSKLDLNLSGVSQTGSTGTQDVLVELDLEVDFIEPYLIRPNLDFTADGHARGRFTGRTDGPAFQTAFDAGLSGDINYFYQPPGSGYTLLALVLEPSTFEATQSFDTVDYTVQAKLQAWVPWSRHPARWVQRAVGSRGDELPAPPIALTGSFVYASNLDKATPPLLQAGGRSRFDLSVVYRIPISKRVEYYLDERFYVFYEKNALQSRTTNYFATGLKLYVDEARRNSFDIGYATGAVPPAYVSDNTVAVGFSARFN